jgi:predicted DsbA family dithiol-disulfide isomerase
MTVRIDVISDVVCPWCFIGKRRLSRALELLRVGAERPEAIEVVWHPFQLNPDLPPQGIDRQEYVQRKFGARSEDVYDRVSAAGRTVGLEFAFQNIVRQPNTAAAHQLIALAREHGRQDEVVESLFRGYFLEGVDLTSPENLVSLAQRAGLAPEAVRAGLADDAQRQQVLDEDSEARALGVSGVPFFIFAQRIAVSGAQEPETLVRALGRAVEEERA